MNIQSVSIIDQKELYLLRAEYALMFATTRDRPSSSFLDYQLDGPSSNNRWMPSYFTQDGDLLKVNRLSWCHEGSGHTFETFKKLLSQFKGEVDLLLFWEGSELSGLRLRNGVVTEHKIAVSIGEQTG
jgi:hypothetical protein